MNWITDYVRPKLQRLTADKKPEISDNLWQKCSSCEQMLFHRDLETNLFVCHYCNYHFRLDGKKRLDYLFDEGIYTLITLPSVPTDPLKFKDSKKYTDRLKAYRDKTNRDDAILVAHGSIGKKSAVVAAFDFSFMGGSMGMAVGEGLVAAAELAIKMNFPLIIVPASGGARMQEGVLALMQMVRTTIAVQLVREAHLPLFLLLTDPTTGGVSASFAMLGDIAIAEPGATIGFTGARVIQETIREKLPAGFQTAEYLRDHGMVDMVVHRKDLSETIARLIDLIRRKK
ncbi:MAG: acetyl-CoA carboxylase, carboxyltransferase subunit beta [Alphaproteobacteria bacterium]